MGINNSLVYRIACGMAQKLGDVSLPFQLLAPVPAALRGKMGGGSALRRQRQLELAQTQREPIQGHSLSRAPLKNLSPSAFPATRVETSRTPPPMSPL